MPDNARIRFSAIIGYHRTLNIWWFNRDFVGAFECRLVPAVSMCRHIENGTKHSLKHHPQCRTNGLFLPTKITFALPWPISLITVQHLDPPCSGFRTYAHSLSQGSTRQYWDRIGHSTACALKD